MMMQQTKAEQRAGRWEKARRAVAILLVLGGWLGSTSIGIWAVVTYDPAKGEFAPQWVGLGYIFLIGVSVAASTARSRMRMTDTIVGAFITGQKLADERWEMIIRSQTSSPDRLTRELERIEAEQDGASE